MTIQEEITQLETKLAATADAKERAEVILELLKKYASLKRTDGDAYIEQLRQLADELNSDEYRAWAIYYTGVHYRDSGNYEGALAELKKAITLFRVLNNQDGIASSYNDIGNVYSQQGKYPEALEKYSAALKIREEIGDRQDIASSHNLIGNIYFWQDNYPEALKNHFASLKINEEIGHKQGIARSYNNIGNVYTQQANYPEALKNYSTSLKIREEIGDKYGIAIAYDNIGIIYSRQGKYTEELKNYLASLKIKQEIGHKYGIASSYHSIGIVYSAQGKYPKALKNYLASVKIWEELGNKHRIAALYNNIGSVYEKQGNHSEALKMLQKALHLAEELGVRDVLKYVYEALCNTHKAMGDYKEALKYYVLYDEVKTEILGTEAQKQLTTLRVTYDLETKEKQLETERLFSAKLQKEKDRSDELLLNILPEEVAEELKVKGHADAVHIDEVTVLFTDFKGFTAMSELLSPKELVADLHECFSAFDRICEKYGIEKIKTIGDAYMAAGGLPSPNSTHAQDVVHAAMEMAEIVENGKAKKIAEGQPYFEIRLGVHTGPVVAGIVGVKKFQYDIWGDTVNTASRMESSGEVGKVNISQTTYELVKEQFTCEHRGKVAAKGKGEINMYFLEQKRNA